MTKDVQEKLQSLQSKVPEVARRYEKATGRSFNRAGCLRKLIKLPDEFIYMTSVVDSQPIVQLTIPITKEQFDALGAGKELWEVLNSDG